VIIVWKKGIQLYEFGEHYVEHRVVLRKSVHASTVWLGSDEYAIEKGLWLQL
jgi:hypothetical protein